MLVVVRVSKVCTLDCLPTHHQQTNSVEQSSSTDRACDLQEPHNSHRQSRKNIARKSLSGGVLRSWLVVFVVRRRRDRSLSSKALPTHIHPSCIAHPSKVSHLHLNCSLLEYYFYQAKMSNQQVGTVYQSIISDVIDASRVDFEEGGVDDAVLEALRQVSKRMRIRLLSSSIFSFLLIPMVFPVAFVMLWREQSMEFVVWEQLAQLFFHCLEQCGDLAFWGWATLLYLAL